MKIPKIILLATFVAVVLSTTTAWAEQQCWRIVNGRGKGFIVSGDNGLVFSEKLGAQGFIALGHFEDCECESHEGHYHGTFAGIPDPDPDGCGWGCVDRVPCNEDEAYDNLEVAILALDDFIPGISDKLFMIINDGIDALPHDCYSLLEASANAVGEEVYGGRANAQITEDQIENLLEAFSAWVNQAMDSMTNLPPATNNMAGGDDCCKISLVRRKGSGAQTKFVDVKAKLNADIGEVIALDVDKCPEGGLVSWTYDFKTVPAGEVESGTGISFTEKRLCVVAERATTVKVTVTLTCPNGKTAKDVVTIVYK
jgi:hypothetical protein